MSRQTKATVDVALEEWADVFRVLPCLDAILLPRGDPGKVPPRLLFPLLAGQDEQLKAMHPRTQWWVAPQGQEHRFYDYVDQNWSR